MRRLLAITATTTTIALGAIIPASVASAATDDGSDTTWDTSVENVVTSWSGTSLKVQYDWDTFNPYIASATWVTSVDGSVVDTTATTDIDYATKVVKVSRATSAAPAKVTIAANFCLDEDGSDTPTCSGGTVFSGTVFNASRGVKGGQVSAVTLLNSLKVRSESHAGSYKRTKFGDGWVDANGDHENTRVEVLKSESKKKVTIRNRTVKTGKWVSAYDGKTFTIGSKLDIDHLVPLQEAWTSGASSWSTKKRTAYANDLGYGASLIAVSKHANRSKGDKDPASYLPPKNSYDCQYVKNYVAVKARWKLSVDSAEKSAIKNVLASCSSYGVKKPGTPVISKLLPKPKPKPTGGGSSGGGGSTHGVDPRYGTCTELLRHPNHAPYIQGVDVEYNWYQDRDHDGRVCE